MAIKLTVAQVALLSQLSRAAAPRSTLHTSTVLALIRSGFAEVDHSMMVRITEAGRCFLDGRK